ncbi:MAG: hypothetical protein ACM3IH_16725 [Sphingobacteriales bacterium]|jgi:hypothetical protein
MKTVTKVIFASALLFSAVAPSLSYAAYFVDQTKTWAVDNARAQDVTDKMNRHKEGAAQTQGSTQRSGYYGTGNTSVPGVGVDKDDRTPKSR